MNIQDRRNTRVAGTEIDDSIAVNTAGRPNAGGYPLRSASLYSDDLNLLAILSTTWRYKFFVALIFLLTMVGAITTFLYVSPVYEASTILLVGGSSLDDSVQDSAKMQMTVRSQAQIAESVDVVKAALLDVGLSNVPLAQQSTLSGLAAKIWEPIPGQKKGNRPVVPVSTLDLVAADVGRMVKVRTEPNSESLIISFSHGDPRFAAKFADALARAFVNRQMELLERPGTVQFYQKQKRRFEDEVEKNSKLFETFVLQQSTYSMSDQLSLLLKRDSEHASALSQTRGSIADRLGQMTALTSQLKLLKPVTQSRYVLGLVNKLGEEPSIQNSTIADAVAPSGEPPLLMVKVFQDAMVALLKVKGELAGLRELERQQEGELLKDRDSLSQLTENRAEYERLKRNVDLAAYNVELFSKRTVDVQISEDLLGARLLTARVVQLATVPLRPSFPNDKVFLGGGTMFGLMLGVILALMLDRRRRSLHSS